MHALNIKEKNTQRQTKPVFNLYKDSLEDIIDSNVNNRVLVRKIFLQLSKLDVPTC